MASASAIRQVIRGWAWKARIMTERVFSRWASDVPVCATGAGVWGAAGTCETIIAGLDLVSGELWFVGGGKSPVVMSATVALC